MLYINIKADSLSSIKKIDKPAYNLWRSILLAVVIGSAATLFPAVFMSCANPAMTVIDTSKTGNEKVTSDLNAAVSLYKTWDAAGKPEGSSLLTQ
jgi:hypothetical protein